MFRHTAHVYDLLYAGAGKDYEAEATALHTLIQERSPGAASLLDVACGTGGHLAHLRRWYDVAGVDIDPGMLAEARRRLPQETFIEGDMRDVRLGRTFDAVCCLFSSIGYMGSVQDLNQAVSTMASHCRPEESSSWTGGSDRKPGGTSLRSASNRLLMMPSPSPAWGEAVGEATRPHSTCII
jgi:SAM-dependent methyltransferase